MTRARKFKGKKVALRLHGNISILEQVIVEVTKTHIITRPARKPNTAESMWRETIPLPLVADIKEYTI